MESGVRMDSEPMTFEFAIGLCICMSGHRSFVFELRNLSGGCHGNKASVVLLCSMLPRC